MEFLYQRDGEIIAFARPDLAVIGKSLSLRRIVPIDVEMNGAVLLALSRQVQGADSKKESNAMN